VSTPIRPDLRTARQAEQRAREVATLTGSRVRGQILRWRITRLGAYAFASVCAAPVFAAIPPLAVLLFLAAIVFVLGAIRLRCMPSVHRDVRRLRGHGPRAIDRARHAHTVALSRHDQSLTRLITAEIEEEHYLVMTTELPT
jgi:hypothetical protein